MIESSNISIFILPVPFIEACVKQARKKKARVAALGNATARAVAIVILWRLPRLSAGEF